MLKITNTLSGKKEALIPIEPGHVKMYVCGPTVYGPIHMGNARPAVVFDAFRRYLEYSGYKVTMVQNFTDIDDKILAAANEKGMPFDEYAKLFIAEYWVDAHLLGLRAANFHPRTTQYVSEIIQLIEKLIAKGHAYVVDGDVYFDVRSFPKYGELSHRRIDDMIAGARVAPDEKKRFPLDFALWKAAKPGEPSWESPWGQGRPGWHIECSAMSMSLLGESFDIHAGGNDLIFPHHENEKAQSEAVTGKPFARYWMHNGMIKFEGEKMAKSIGNVFNLREAIWQFGKDGVKLFLLSKHYRSPVELTYEALDESRRAASRVKETLKRAEERGVNILIHFDNSWVNEMRAQFKEALDDDFNTSKAIALIFELSRELNSALERGDTKRAATAYSLITREFGQVLGMFDTLHETMRIDEESSFEETLYILLEIREILRKEKRYDLADKIRESLRAIGVKLEDTPQGTRYTLDKHA
mgnify:FL=1